MQFLAICVCMPIFCGIIWCLNRFGKGKYMRGNNAANKIEILLDTLDKSEVCKRIAKL